MKYVYENHDTHYMNRSGKKEVAICDTKLDNPVTILLFFFYLLLMQFFPSFADIFVKYLKDRFQRLKQIQESVYLNPVESISNFYQSLNFRDFYKVAFPIFPTMQPYQV